MPLIAGDRTVTVVVERGEFVVSGTWQAVGSKALNSELGALAGLSNEEEFEQKAAELAKKGCKQQ